MTLDDWKRDIDDKKISYTSQSKGLEIIVNDGEFRSIGIKDKYVIYVFDLNVDRKGHYIFSSDLEIEALRFAKKYMRLN